MDYFKKLNDSSLYHDLRNRVDDKRVLENPNKGWYVHYIDNGIKREFYRDGIPDGDYLEDIHGLNLIYMRIDWSDIEKADGVYDWSEIDRIISAWSAHGYKFTFRFVTYEGNGKTIPFAAPEWVFYEKGAKFIKVGDAYEPVYDDPIFLEYLERFFKECARKFDANPLVEYIDVSGFGTWGEFHTWAGSLKKYPYEVLKYYVDMNIRCFPNTQIICNYGIATTTPDVGNDRREFIDYCSQMGLGIRCDSVNVESYTIDYGYDSLKTPDVYEFFYNTAPVDIEHEHMKFTTPERAKSGLPYIEALRQAHATYSGFHHWVREWHQNNEYLHDYIANRLGYWYFIDGYALPNEVPVKAKAILTIDVHNSGFAVAYKKYDARIRLFGEDGATFDLECNDCDNTKWHPNENVTEHIKLKFDNIPTGKYKIGFGLFNKDNRAIEFAVKNEYVSDGYVILGDITVK